jgi:hypothetical protein
VKTGDTTTETPNVEYTKWVAHDQSLLSYLLVSLSRHVLMGIMTHKTSVALWHALEDMFSLHTRAQTINLRIALATTKKGASTMAEYYLKVKNYADEMSTAG